MSNKKVCILMSTYNGEKFINEQIDSILNQSHSNIKLIIRDDGSTDNTLHIINNYNDDRITLYTGQNKKPALSFWDLVCNCEAADYYAFADQDDVWDSHKIEKAIEMLETNSQKPLLYFCRKRIVDDKLKQISGTVDLFDKKVDLGLTLVRCVVAGCTMVFNNQLREYLIQYTPKKMIMHDMWTLLVANCFGEVIADDRIFMSYRQHSNNCFGAHTNRTQFWRDRVSRILSARKEHSRSIMAKELFDFYGSEMSPNKRKIVREFGYIENSFKNRISLVCNRSIRNIGYVNTILIKLKILLGWI